VASGDAAPPPAVPAPLTQVQEAKSRVWPHAELSREYRELVARQLGVDPGTVTGRAKFDMDLGADDLDLVELTITAEDMFNVEIPGEMAKRARTVEDQEKLICQRLGSRCRAD
jgi:acyl carrier protein